MRNLWAAGRELTFACAYLAQMQTRLDGSPGDADAGSLGRYRGSHPMGSNSPLRDEGHQVRQPYCRPRAQGIVGVPIPREARDIKLNLSVSGHGSIVSATTHSAAVKRLLHVAVQPLIVEVWFPLLLRSPSPAGPAPPGSPGRTRRAPERTRRVPDAPKLSAPARPLCAWLRGRPSAQHSPQGAVAVSRGWARRAKGNPSRRWRGASPQPTGGIFHLTRSTL
ncbi:uncharacterized protein V5649_001015 [Rhynchonycteris naso]